MIAPRNVSTLSIADRIALLKIDSPPVNALSHAVRVAIHDGLRAALADPEVDAVVLCCGGRMFFAGADISELSRPLLPPLLGDIIALMEAAAKPVVAAMHGAALGGGLELSLACNYRAAVPSASFGLPEVALGLLPAAGGTQRLPRLTGVAAATQMMVSGRPVDAETALRLGLIDTIVAEGALEAGAMAFARDLVARKAPQRRVRDLPTDLDVEAAAAIFAAFRREHPALFTGFKAPTAILEAVDAAVRLPFEDGLAREKALSRDLNAGSESKALRHLFAAERTAVKVPDLAPDVKPRPVTTVRVKGTTEVATALAGLFTASGFHVTVDGPGNGTAPAADLVIDATGAPPSDDPEGAATDAVLVVTTPLLDSQSLSGRRVALQIALVNGQVALLEIGRGVETDEVAVASLLAVARRLRVPVVVERPVRGYVLARLKKAGEEAAARLSLTGIAEDTIRTALAECGIAPCGPGAIADAAAGEVAVPAEVARSILYSLVDEAALLVEDQTALRASDIDLLAVKALGWPAWRGGPLFWGRHIGYRHIADHLAATAGERDTMRRPSPALRNLAAQEKEVTL
ncbi:enoyl-CoA hydratase-related protein [Xanthobacter flavus]|uniref:enoyl-CoA hydratase-related protein n=1 Tax=Xanthobacter flavus TaxID=281 RepID=UPI00372931CB